MLPLDKKQLQLIVWSSSKSMR